MVKFYQMRLLGSHVKDRHRVLQTGAERGPGCLGLGSKDGTEGCRSNLEAGRLLTVPLAV